MNVIRELLHIKHNFASMTLYKNEEIDFIVEYCCTSYTFYSFFIASFYVCLLCRKFV